MQGEVLIVDDDVNACIIAETLLRSRGMRVRSAGDGTEACEIVGSGGIAVVVLELALPGMNGFEVIRRLRGRFEPLTLASPLRIVVASHRCEPEIERFAVRLGADVFLHKPVPPARFVKVVEQLLIAAAGDADTASPA